jgi:hypothetical protein
MDSTDVTLDDQVRLSGKCLEVARTFHGLSCKQFFVHIVDLGHIVDVGGIERGA